MDIFEEEPEIHVDLSQVKDQTANWKQFKLLDCSICGKKPSILRDFDVEGPGRYKIRCCGRAINAKTETKAMYDWNLLQSDD